MRKMKQNEWIKIFNLIKNMLRDDKFMTVGNSRYLGVWLDTIQTTDL